MRKDLIRKNILALVPYSSARGEFTGQAGVFLDANENAEGSVVLLPYAGKLERYPDPLQRALKEKLAALRGVSPQQIFIGNGSDEGIDLLIRACCEPQEDSILIFEPTYGMYEVQAAIQNVPVIRVPLKENFALDAKAILAAVKPRTKIIFLCTPNNPTGNMLDRREITAVLDGFDGLVVVDEAYVDFTGEQSWLTELSRRENLVVLQTLSKSYGLAGTRVGFLFGNPEIVAVLSKIKYPYNVSVLAQTAALEALQKEDAMRQSVQRIIAERERLSGELKKIPEVLGVYPSSANFLLVKTRDGKGMTAKLREHGVIVRDRSSTPGCKDCVRVSIGTREENDLMLGVLRGEAAGKNLRSAEKRRSTKETDIRVDVVLDGSGRAQINTGLGFFDHMLEQIAKHSSMDLTIAARGDLHIDEHHTVEDTAIAIGAALREALGDKRGIERYGFVLPMDEALATVAIDLSGRSYLVWNVKFSRERVGELPTELVQHFFRSLTDAAGITLNVEAHGDNDHHIIESIFKAFSRALRIAITQRNSNELPSTKGVL